jgi:hypothetical protein
MKMMSPILAMTLDLEHHPENAIGYAVNVLARTIPTVFATGNLPPEGKENRLLQFVKATRVPVHLVPRDLDNIHKQMVEAVIRKYGRFPIDILIVRVTVTSTHSPRTMCHFCSIIKKVELSCYKIFWPSLSTPEHAIDIFNAQPNIHEDLKCILTTTITKQEI